MELLRGLGVNSTLGYQVGIFIGSYLVLYYLVFRPYFSAYTERMARTMGRTELAEKFIAESQLLQAEYETKARDLSARYKTIFDESRSQAMREYDRIVGEARLASKSQVETITKKIHTELGQATQAMQKEIGPVAQVIAARLLGKDLQS